MFKPIIKFNYFVELYEKNYKDWWLFDIHVQYDHGWGDTRIEQEFWFSIADTFRYILWHLKLQRVLKKKREQEILEKAFKSMEQTMSE